MFLLTATLSLTAAAQTRLEIIPLQHRLPEQVLPVLQPLLEPGESLSAMSGKLILRASPASIARVQETLAAIDQPARRLLITVRQGSTQDESRTQADVRGDLRIDPQGVQPRIRLDAGNQRTQNRNQGEQQVQTVEDGEALITLGTSVPTPVERVEYGPGGGTIIRETRYVQAASGFMARPRLADERVTVTIAPQQARLTQGGRIQGSGLSTTVSGRLGEWLPLGSVSVQGSQHGSGTGGYQRSESTGSVDYWLRVDLLAP
ncbi:MAG: hypothetical protein CGU28_01500 [Candidatus Dactylopiibacterium carminicum]|nr:hypothetical protein BGI27_06150 [Candidatus Dactylopiibacterium carminicum]PAS98269.1 MAG: hypothetical protein CGU28_01500 [Candidatus Dactylopiibacterium carminicum]PAS99777.1 MAG: hypothetical protein BSR46_06185 [Candidatus Dactylopiibacterium carminicum]